MPLHPLTDVNTHSTTANRAMTIHRLTPARLIMRLLLACLCLGLAPAQADRITRYTYDTQGNVLTINGPRMDVDDIITYTYNAQGYRASMTVDPDGSGPAPAHVTHFTRYDNSGRLLSMTDPNGVVTNMTYDARGRLNTRTIAAGTGSEATTGFTYDNVGNVTGITLANRNTLTYTYDAANRLTRMTDRQGNYIEYTLDNLGNRIKEEIFDRHGSVQRTHRRVFDQLSRLIQTVSATHDTTVYGYDSNGNQVSSLDALHRSRTSSYDALNRLSRQTDPDNHSVAYTYDARDNITRITDPRGLVTTYFYDGLNNQTRRVSPDSGATAFTYDQAGNRLTATDAHGVVKTYAYDALNRLTRVSYSDSQYNVTYTYDQGVNGIGRLSAIHDSSGRTAYTYDPRGNIIGEQRTFMNRVYTTRYDYDLADQLVNITSPNGLRITYGYNIDGQIATISATDAQGMQTIASGITYRPFGPLERMTMGNGLVTTYHYDQDYRLTGINTPGIYSVSYTYDRVNNITHITDHLGGGGFYERDANYSQAMAYDRLDRLVRWSSDGIKSRHIKGRWQGYRTAFDYGYDASGNRVSEQQVLDINGGEGIDLFARIDHRSNQVRHDGLVARQYDGLGNTSYKGAAYNISGQAVEQSSVRYSYGDDGRMRKAVVGDSIAYRFKYNGKGERVYKAASQRGLVYAASVFHYDLSGQLMAESRADGTPIKDYIYLGSQPVAMVVYETDDTDGDGVNDFEDNCRQVANSDQRDTNSDGFGNLCDGDLDNNGMVDGRDRRIMQAGIEQYHADADLDGNGVVDDRDEALLQGMLNKPPGPGAGVLGRYYYYQSDHLHTPRIMTDRQQKVVWQGVSQAFGVTTVTVDEIENNLRFPGQYYDAGMGTHYNYFRDYDPRVGRYLQSDPIGLAGGMNTYGYVENNPFRYIDPLGLNPNKMKQRHRNIESITNLLDYTYCQWNPGACLFRCVRWRCSRESECGVTEYYYIGESDPYAVSPGYNPKEDKNCVCVKECFQGQANCAGR